MLAGVICCGCWMGEREAREAENSGQEAAGSGQKTEIRDQGPAIADAASNDHRAEVGSRRSEVIKQPLTYNL